MAETVRRLPAGAEISPEGVNFRVWAPEHDSIEAEIAGDTVQYHALKKERDEGYFSGIVTGIGTGALYKYRVDGGQSYPDPASRFQPEGPHGYSQVVDPGAYHWRDQSWKGAKADGQVLYEMHIGTFTREGTWQGAIPHLKHLRDTGITLLEVMPVHEFPGKFGWSYDGVSLYAPTHLYGNPDDFRHFVDEAHQLGLGVILDVVYNHLGPDGNYAPCFSKYYFTDKYETDWGEAINYQFEHSGPVREFFTANAAYWIDEFHLDGLRLDATQNIYDESKDHILAAVVRAVRKAAGGRSTIVVGENEPQEVKLLRPPKEGGYGLDALWNDDFHHTAMVRLTGRNEAYYTDYLGTPQEFVSSAKYGYLYQGQWYRWQHKRRGSSTRGFRLSSFVTFIQNHDQVANSARGERAHMLTGQALYKAMVALWLLMPGTPMLFQGEEFASSAPFNYFADHKPELAALVKDGRRKFLSQFRSLALPNMAPCFASPHEWSTFESAKLDHTERERGVHRQTLTLYRDLLQLRRADAVVKLQGEKGIDGAVLSSEALVLRHFGEGEDRLVITNFGRDLQLNPAPEPLLAPMREGTKWGVAWSTEAPEYGGCGVPPADTVENWKIPGRATLFLKPIEGSEAVG